MPYRYYPRTNSESFESILMKTGFGSGLGRQKGPMCKPNTNERLDWASPLLAIQETFYKRGIRLNPGIDPATTGFVHSYTTNEVTTKASKQQLISLVGGDKGGVSKAGRSAMINYEIPNDESGWICIYINWIQRKRKSRSHFQI